MIALSDNYRDLKSFSGFDILKEHGLGLLKETIEVFFNCKVSYLFEPNRQAKKNFDISLHETPGRGCYPINKDCFLIYARVLDGNTLVSGLGLILNGKDIAAHKSFMNHFEGALSRSLSKSYKKWFEDCSLIFGDALILHAICNFSVRGFFDYRKFYHAVSLFQKLRTTTFEGEYFSTGLIITKSHHAFKGKNGEERCGNIYPLTGARNLKDTFKIEKRFWYLADGKQCFFVANKELRIGHLFFLNEEYKGIGYIDSNSLSLSLKGGDVLFRVEGEGILSIINSESMEFLYVENQWRMRNFKIISSYLSSHLSQDVISRLLFFIMYCSKNNMSTVVWIPYDMSSLKNYVKEETLNSVFYEPISILEPSFTNHIFRCLSSDGATIISQQGDVLHYGAIVDIGKLDIRGVKGTGESAAQALSKNGIAIKVSQDGAIKMYLQDQQDAILV